MCVCVCVCVCVCLHVHTQALCTVFEKNKSVYFVIQRACLPVAVSSACHTRFQSRWVFTARKCYIDFGMF